MISSHTMSTLQYRIFLSLVGLLCVIAAISIGRSYYKDMYAPIFIPAIEAPASSTQSTQPNTDHPFIKIERTSGVASRGGIWMVDITTNTWAKCLVDLYQPNEQVFAQTVQDAKATFIGPGAYNWAWKVPKNIQSGRWIARILCGSADNLATTDQFIQVE